MDSAAPGESQSKNARKKELKNKQREEESRREEEEKAAKQAAAKASSQSQKPAGADDEDMDPMQFHENRLKFLASQKAEGKNPCPQFFTSMSIDEYIDKYGSLGNREHTEEVSEPLDERIMSKGSSSSKPFFDDLHGDGVTVQVMADASKSGLDEAEFAKFRSSVKLGDMVGVTGFPGIPQATEISPYGDPGAFSSSTAAASHGEMRNSLQFHYQRPAASHNNPPGNQVVIDMPSDGEFTSGHQTIPAEGRVTRDGETAGHSKFFEILLPVNFLFTYEAVNILKSTNQILSPSIKTSGYLIVAFAFVAAFSNLAGFSLSTFRPSTLPFGWNPQIMLQIIHISTVFSLGYAFIGIMCHEFLQDDPIILWMVEGLAYAVLTAVLVFIISRR